MTTSNVTSSKGFALLGIWALTSVAFDSNATTGVRVLASVAAAGMAFDFVNRAAETASSKPHALAKPKELVFEVVETIEI